MAFDSIAQTPTSMLNPPQPAMCDVEYPITPSFAYNETRFLGVGLTTTFTYQILSPVAGPTVSENRGVGALSSGATSYTFATPITSGLTIGQTNTIRFCVAGNCANFTVFIYPKTDPGVITGSTAVCLGNTATLTLGGHNGGVVEWQSSTNGGALWTSIASTTGLTSYTPPAPAATTHYRAVVQSGYTSPGPASAGACSIDYSSLGIITVNTYPVAPTISSNSPICSGNTINLFASSSASGATYSWTTTATTPFTSSFQNPSIASSTTAMSGTYSCTVTTNGCTSPAANTTVTVNQTPSPPNLTSNTPVCTGNDLNLTATPTVALPGATYNWTGPNSFNSSVQNPTIIAASIAAAGTYSATVTTAEGCISTIGTTSGAAGTPAGPVVMVQRPNAPIAGSNSAICTGQTLNITATTIPSATYTWTGPAITANPALANVQNPSVASATTAATGTYSVFTTATALAGCNSATTSTNVVVNALPTAPTLGSNTPVCVGGTLLLTASAAAGVTYSWSGPNGFSAANQNPGISNVTAAAGGTYSATVNQTSTGCTSTPATTNVVINPTPAALILSNSGPVCEGTTLNLTSNTIAGTYAWTGPNGFTSTLEDPAVPATTSAAQGTYSATITVAGCVSPSSSTNAIIKPIPAAPVLSSNSPVCVGQPINLFAGNVSGGTFSWTGPGGYVSGVQNPVIASATLANGGVYTCTVTVNGCTSVAATITVVVNAIPATPAPSSNTPVCQGAVLNLTTASVVGASYAWTGPNSFTSTTRTPSIASVQPAAAGSYSVTVTVNGCTSLPGTTNVVINSTPATPLPNSNSAICSGATLNLSSNLVAGAVYAWTGPNSFSSATQNPSIPGATSVNAGTYYLTVSVSGCVSNVASTSVTVNPTPANPTPTNNGPLCVGGTLQLSTPAVASATYNWSGPGFVSTLQNPMITNVTAANAGVYSLFISLGSCASAVVTTTVTVNALPATPSITSNSPVCAGATINLSTPLIGGTTYSWTSSTGFTSSSNTVSIPSSTSADAGSYTVTINNGTCTSLPATTNLVVNPIPNAPIASSNSPICSGATINLFANTITGATYTWSGPVAVPSVQNPTIAGANAATHNGTYSAFVTVNGCNSATGSTTISVITTPATPTVTSNTPICEGQTLNLSATLVAGATYAWTGPNAFTANTRNPSITAATLVAAGSYSVVATIGSCSSAAGSGNVVINALPIAPSIFTNSPLCAGGTLTLNAETIPAVTYSWTGPNGFTSAVEDPTIVGATTAASGTYIVRATSAAGCQGPTSSTSVTVKAIPASPVVPATLGPVCEGTNLNLTASNIVGATYNWTTTSTNGFTSSLQNPTIANAVAADAGNYSVVATVSGCTSAPATTAVTLSPSPAAPTASSDSPACVGDVVTLQATPVIGGATYAWTGPAGYTATGTNPSFTTTNSNQTGIYSVIVTSGGCPSSPGTTQVDVYAIPTPPAVSNNGPVCEGGVLDLFAGPISGAIYSWTGPGGYTSPLQNPSINNIQLTGAGSYDLIVTVNGCVSTTSSSTIVTVNDTPDAPLAGSNSPLCAGQTLNLTSSSPVPGVTYTWTGPNGFGTTTQNPSKANVTGADGGTYFVTATDGLCTSPSGLVPVTISTAPTTPTASYTNVGGSICEGTDLQLHVNTIIGAVYNWTGPNSFSSTDQNPIITGASAAAAGVYSVTATVGGGCSGPPGTVNVVITPAPASPVASTVTSNSPLCSSNSINLTCGTIAGVTYDWTGPLSFTSTAQNPVITNATIAHGGTYTVRTYDGTCYSANSASVNVVVNLTPNAPVALSNSPLCVGNNLNLTASSVPGATYSWTGPSAFSSVLQNPTRTSVIAAHAGTYSVIATVGACASPAGSTNVVITSPGATPVVSVANTGTLCEGVDLQLQTSTVTGANYTWTGPNGFISSDQNPLIPNITLVNEGNYVVTVTTSGACSTSNSAPLFVDVSPAPTAPVAATSNTPICSSSSINLSVETIAGVTYSWSGPNGFTSTSQNPTIANASIVHNGYYRVNSNDGTCLSADADSVLVLVQQTPNAPNATSNGPLCAGSTLQLDATQFAGATYNWTGPLGFGAVIRNPTRANVIPTHSGNYNVTATVNGCVSPVSTVAVVVDPTPTPPTVSYNNSNPLCEGETIFLQVSTVPNATYSWTGPNGFTSALQNPIILNSKLVNEGNYIVTVSISGACATSTSGALFVDITASPAAPTATTTALITVCSEQSINLTATGGAGLSYEWKGPNGYSSTLQNPVIASANFNNTGDYTVRTNNGTCFSAVADTVVVIVNQTPNSPIISNNGPVCIGGSISLVANPITGATYAWTGPGSYTASGANPAPISPVTLADAGDYFATITINGCTSPSSKTTVAISSTTNPGVASTLVDTICGGTNSGTVTLTGYSGTILNWQTSIDGGQTWVNLVNTGAVQNFSDLSTTTQFSAIVKDGVCPQAVSTSQVITVIEEAAGGEIMSGIAQPELCLGTNGGELKLINYSGVVTHWELSENGGVKWDTIANTSDSLQFTNLITTTAYRVHLAGCTNQTYSNIEVLEVSFEACNDNMIIASLVTPNGDKHNDTWMIKNIESYPPIKVMIMNRYGTEMFATEAYANEWEGLYNGDKLPDGTYYYVVEIPTTGEIYRGHINLMH